MLTPYYMTRLKCFNCGTYEIGTADRPDPAEPCVWCDETIETIAQCRGATSRPLPYTTDPHDESGARSTPIDVINGQLSDNRRRRHNNGKSTGRKRGSGKGRSTYRGENSEHNKDYDRERYRGSKGTEADPLDGPSE